MSLTRSLRDKFRGAHMGLALVLAERQRHQCPDHQTAPIRLLQSVLSGLLHHHDHYQHRHQRLSQINPKLTAAEFAHCLLAGDWLETCMANQPSASETQIGRYALSDEQHAIYQKSHRKIQQTVVLESYALSVHSARATEEFTLWELAITGTVIGAYGGVAALPVSWQLSLNKMNLKRSQIIATADQNYESWAGVLT